MTAGEVEYEECDGAAENVDEIPHAKVCSQRFARSDRWVQHLFDGD